MINIPASIRADCAVSQPILKPDDEMISAGVGWSWTNSTGLVISMNLQTEDADPLQWFSNSESSQ